MSPPRECEHGMPTPASCTLCMDDGPVAEPPPAEHETVAFTMTAHHDGQCGECNLPIVPGQTIVKLEPTGRYAHSFCWTNT